MRINSDEVEENHRQQLKEAGDEIIRYQQTLYNLIEEGVIEDNF